MMIPKVKRDFRRRKLFLRWFFVNVFCGAMLITLGSLFADRIHGASLVGIPVILLVLLGASLFGGWLSWKADSANSKLERDTILHEARYLTFAAWACQILGIMSTIVGFWILLSGNIETDTLSEKIQSGAGVALLGSFVGILASLVLELEHRLIEHDISKPS